jgi:hypothetical protein
VEKGSRVNNTKECVLRLIKGGKSAKINYVWQDKENKKKLERRGWKE